MGQGTGSAVKDPLGYDPLQLYDDPYPIYQRLRDEFPVYFAGVRNCWMLSRFEDVQAAARDWETFSMGEGSDLDDTALLFAPAGELTHVDPPDHTRMRDAVRRDFGVGKVRENLEPTVREKVKRLIEAIQGSAQVDFAERLALPLPGSMICGWLGFPEEDHRQILDWFEAMLVRTPGEVTLPPGVLPARDEMRAYIREAMAERRRQARPDLLTAIVAAIDKAKISEDEGIGMSMHLFFAGITTTSALIANSILNLSRFEDQLALIKRQPEIIPMAVEELLRFDAPIQWLTRVATKDVELHGTEIPEGSRVVLLWASANRDERRWERADQLELEREKKRHISFGEGIHHCLGAPLARLETKVLLEELLPLIGSYEINGPVKRLYTQSERTISRLPAAVEWA